MEKDSKPKRPATAFFLFREKERTKGNAMGSKEAGEKWNNLSEEERQKYFDEYKEGRERFDTYLEEEGVLPRSSQKKQSKPLCYRGSRVRAVCGINQEIKPMTSAQCRALAQLAVNLSM